MTEAPDPMVAVARGLAVFALPPGGNFPAHRGWQQGATADPGQVLRTWHPGDNIGVGCWASGVVGLDLDVADGHRTEDDGAAVLAAACAAEGQPWPATFTVSTPSGGMHLYFRVPPGRVVTTSSGGRSRLGPGIDVRGPGRGGRGGYLVGPDSVVGGRRYRITRDAPIRPLPDWLTERLALPLREHRNGIRR